MADTKEYFERALAEVDTLPPVSNVLCKILDLTEGEGGSREEVVRCVMLDQAVAAKVLQMINSAYYGMERQITSLDVAVGLLGDKRVREIAIMCAASSVLRGGIQGYGVPPDQFWLHSITTGFAARLIADRCLPGQRETAFAAGLLHDIGKVVINRLIEESHKEIFSKSAGEMSPDYHSKESDLYGFDHCTVGYFIAQKWEFPGELVAAIAFHHFPNQDVEHVDMVRAVCFADVLSHLLSMGVHDPNFVAVLEEEGHIPFDLPDSEIETIFDNLKEEAEKSQAFLGI